MSAIQTNVKLTGDKQIKRMFKELPTRTQKIGLRSAMSAGGTPMLRSVKERAPDRTGLLRRANKKKIKSYPSGNVVCVIGVDKSVVGEVNGKKHWPIKIDHLVAYGHGGPAPAPAHNYMREALSATADIAARTSTTKLLSYVQEQAAKLGNS